VATKTLGTNANNSLTAVQCLTNGGNGLADADIATIASGIKDDLNPAHPVLAGAFSKDGLLFIPRRGFLQLQTGDVVATDGFGNVILVTSYSITNGPWHLA